MGGGKVKRRREAIVAAAWYYALSDIVCISIEEKDVFADMRMSRDFFTRLTGVRIRYDEDRERFRVRIPAWPVVKGGG